MQVQASCPIYFVIGLVINNNTVQVNHNEINIYNNTNVIVLVVEMIQAASDMGTSMIRDLAAAIIFSGKVPSDWEQNFIVCLQG